MTRVRGRVTEGSRIGRELGFPTANIAVPDGLEVADGVYAAIVEYAGRRYRAMANLGVKPTFAGKGGGTRTLELHLFDFEGDLYGAEIEAQLLQFIRPEHKFANADELRAQIEQDRETIKTYFKCT